MAMDNKAGRRYNKLVVRIILSVNKLLALQSHRGKILCNTLWFLSRFTESGGGIQFFSRGYALLATCWRFLFFGWCCLFILITVIVQFITLAIAIVVIVSQLAMFYPFVWANLSLPANYLSSLCRSCQCSSVIFLLSLRQDNPFAHWYSKGIKKRLGGSDSCKLVRIYKGDFRRPANKLNMVL